MPSELVYQQRFSALLPDAMYSAEQRQQKAKKILRVLEDYLRRPTENLVLLDVGCSTGIMTAFIARRFGRAIGVDIDEEAVVFAGGRNNLNNLSFALSDALKIPVRTESVDVVLCAHVYEHVPDATKMVEEIHRVLRPGGICFFSAGNRLSFMEPHYRLPFLSIMPKPLADWLLRGLGRGDHYYEKHLTYWGLKRLVSDFQLIDYTKRIIDDPERFAATDVCPPGSRVQRMASLIARMAGWLIPTYVFVLKKSQ